MPASFAPDLCRYRGHGKPNTSDAHDKASVELGRALFEVLGVPADAKGDEPTGGPFARQVAADLAQRTESQRESVLVEPERPLNVFQQYRHVGAVADIQAEPSKAYERAWQALLKEVRKGVVGPSRAVTRLEARIAAVEQAGAADTAARFRLLREIGSESLLKLDVAIGRSYSDQLPELEVGISLKWSLRTDRAQDCRSQGAKVSALRRGRMPHFAALTMEPRPYMLNLLGGGSGDLDCVYHLNLPALSEAVHAVYGSRIDKRSRQTLGTFQRLVDQRRVRDYDELVSYVTRL